MAEENGTLKHIAWRQVLPWLNLATSVGIAMRTRALLLAALGVLLTIGGWEGLARVYARMDDDVAGPWLNSYRSCPWNPQPLDVPVLESDGPRPTVIQWPRPSPDIPPANSEAVVRLHDSVFTPPAMGQFPTSPYRAGWWELSAPFRQIFYGSWTFGPLMRFVPARLTLSGLTFVLLCALWVCLVWSFLGGAITRMAALQLTREETIGWREALKYSVGKWRSYFAAPLVPMLGVFIATIPMALAGVMLRFDVGSLLVGVLWPALLVGGLLMATFLVGALFGWPMMWAAISTEGSDSFDALSRSYSYVYQRPFHLFFYAVVAAVLGVLGGMLVFWFAMAVVHLTCWAVSWGTTDGKPLMLLLTSDGSDLSDPARWASNLIWFWNGCVALLAVAFVYSYFWTASTAIYLLLRHNIDGTEMDEAYVDEAPSSPELPTMSTDPTNVALAGDENGVDVPPSDSSAAPTGSV